MKSKLLSISALLALLASTATPASAITWLNETNLSGEADAAFLIFPSSIVVDPGFTTSLIYAQLYEAGVTDPAGAPVGWSAQIGYGPAGTDPRVDGSWIWLPAIYDSQQSSSDQFRASFAPAYSGSYSYTYRFSSDSFASATLADLDGAGSNAGLTLSTAQFGAMTVTGNVQPPLPEPTGGVLLIAGLGLVLAGRRRPHSGQLT